MFTIFILHFLSVYIIFIDLKFEPQKNTQQYKSETKLEREIKERKTRDMSFRK
jgi:hypothetical protein